MLNDPNEIIARLYPVAGSEGGGSGGGEKLTIRSPDGSSAVYDGSAPVRADITLGELQLKIPSGYTIKYSGAGLMQATIGTGANGTIGPDDIDPSLGAELESIAGFQKGRIYDVAAYIANPPDGKSLRKAGYDDDGDVIQRVIELAKTQQDGGAPGSLIYFAPGVYKITHTLFYYSNMAFVFAQGAQIYRASNSYDAIIPGDVFSNWFEESFTSYATATAGGSYARRFATDNVAFIGGDFYGDPNATNGAGNKKGPAMIACCHARNVKVIGCTFHGNRGAHCIEINSSDFVEVTGCRLYGYESDGSPQYSEMIQIDAANNSGYGSKLGATISTVTVGGQSMKSYTVDENSTQRTCGGYYKYTRIAGNATNRAGRLLSDMQCCHFVRIHGNLIETSAAAAAVGDHLTGDAANTGVSAPTWGSDRDRMQFIQIFANHFYGPGNSDAAAAYRGVVSFGEALGSADVWANVFENTRTAATYDVAVGCRAASPSLRLWKNRFDNFPTPSWEETGGGSVDPTVTSLEWEQYTLTDTAPATVSARIYTRAGWLYAHVRIGSDSAALTTPINLGASGRASIATIDQSYRPHRILSTSASSVDCAIAGWARSNDGATYYPVTGYVSAGNSTSSFVIIGPANVNLRCIVVDYCYQI